MKAVGLRTIPETVSDIVGYYREIAAQCSDLRVLDARQKGMQASLVPRETRKLAQWADAATSDDIAVADGLSADEVLEATRQWTRRLRRLMRKSANARVEPFERENLSEALVLFTSGGPKADKTLLLVFTGQAMGAVGPMPAYLQCLDADRCDVLLVRDRSRRGFQGPIPGTRGTIVELWDDLPAAASIADYRRLVCHGVSSGSLAAVATTLTLGFEDTTIFGPIHPERAVWRDPQGRDAMQFFGQLGAGRPRPLKIFCGADEAPDLVAAECIASVIPAEVELVRDPERSVGHDVLLALLRSARLREVLASVMH